MISNPLIDFLAAYGPTPDGNNMYDEFVVSAAQKADIKAISIPERRSNEIVDDLLSDHPVSTILTGTAGDGKTYTARRVLHKLTDGKDNWSNTQSCITVTKNDKKIHFIKDLSEVSEKDKARLIPKMLTAFTIAHAPSDLFVLCVNDGHLLRTWREHAGSSPEARATLEAFQLLLKDDRERPDEYAFRLVNMSRRSHAETLDDIIDAICEHPGWSDCPSNCTALGPANRCPILVNRDEFLKRGGATLRDRLKSLIEIAAADDEHLSIRQIIVLVVNAILGDAKNLQATPLLNCNRARLRASNDERAATNPFNNIFGENLQPIRRHGFTAFVTLSRFGIGYETNNHFDDMLLYPSDSGDVVSHEFYGDHIFASTRNNYTENPEMNINVLRSELIAQRRRLFFTVPDVDANSDREKHPWLLTIHHYGDMFSNLLCDKSNRDESSFRHSRARIIKGLNRALTGSLTETQDRLWLTQPSGVYRGVDVPLLIGTPIGWRGHPYHLDLVPPAVSGRPPRLNLVADEKTLVSLAITPTVFEYLMRVADGSLPTSFSSQCFQDIRNFQIRCVGAIQKLLREQDREIEYSAVRTTAEKLGQEPIGILEEDY